MSRSVKKNPYRGVTPARSDRYFKILYARSFRRDCTKALRNEHEVPVRDIRAGDRESEKDGKFRFDPRKHKEFLRK